MALSDKHREICSISVGTGDTTSFWYDKWRQATLQEELHRIFSFALDKNIPVQGVVQPTDTTNLFHLPLSNQASVELQQVQHILSQTVFSRNDSWKTIWKNGIYTSNQFYHYTFKDQHTSSSIVAI
jgi:hypothetical protein